VDGSVIVYSRSVEATVGEDVDVRLSPAGSGAIDVELVGVDELPATLSLRVVRVADADVEGTFVATLSGLSFDLCGVPAGQFQVS
jgi:hypothetical protein